VRHTLAFLGEGVEKLFLCAEDDGKASDPAKSRELVGETLKLFSSTFRAKRMGCYYNEPFSPFPAGWVALKEDGVCATEETTHHLSLAWSHGGRLLFALLLEGSLSDDGAFDEFDRLLFRWLVQFVKTIWEKVFSTLDEFLPKPPPASVASASSFFPIPFTTNAEQAVMDYVVDERGRQGEKKADLMARIAGWGYQESAFLAEFQLVLREVAMHNYYAEALEVLKISSDTLAGKMNRFADLVGVDRSGFQGFMRNHVRGQG
jgi:hypothetical protein